MDLSQDTHTRDRIFGAADALYDQAGRSAFPTVDAVRKAARVNMNDASAGMKEWRRAQTAQAAPVAVQVPEAIQKASGAALAALWQEAQELATESLRAAQAGWDAERVEAETLNRQMADAYEAQASELEAAQARTVELEAATRQAAEQAEAQRQQIEDARTALAGMQQRAATAEARAGELRTELDRAHQDAGQVRAELVKVQAKAEAADQAHQEQRKAAAAEAHRQAERLTAAQGERDQARKEAAQAREDAARLAGQLDTLKEQSAALLARLTPAATRP